MRSVTFAPGFPADLMPFTAQILERWMPSHIPPLTVKWDTSPGRSVVATIVDDGEAVLLLSPEWLEYAPEGHQRVASIRGMFDVALGRTAR